MTIHRVNILIAGAGWRVWRFVVPALLAAGHSREAITVLRRSADAELHPNLAGIQIVTSLEALKGENFDITLNCAAAVPMLGVEEALVRRFPRARHFCDTPTFAGPEQASAALRLGSKRLNSLEDWPLMPNLAYFVKCMRCTRGAAELRIENFGILTHFLSLYRTIQGNWRLFSRELTRGDGIVIGTPAREKSVLFRSRKNLPLAKVALQTPGFLIEDFHEVETAPHDDREVLYRVVSPGQIAYHLGSDVIDRFSIDPAWIASFEPFRDRKNVHELDKFIGLVRLFRAQITGAPPDPYSYLASVRDNLTSLRLAGKERSRLH
jgi:hypothetical protein